MKKLINIFKIMIMTKIRYLTLLFLISSMFFNCANNKTQEQWDIAEINSEKPVFKDLDKQEEIFTGFEKQNKSIKKTSDVAYFSGEKIDLIQNKYSKSNNCRAFYFRNDVLIINIGLDGILGGYGFRINYKDKKFYTEPYLYDDLVDENEKEPTYKIVFQNLILDKYKYAIGDSLFGRIEFKSIEINNNTGDTIQHYGKGYFRTKVTKK